MLYLTTGNEFKMTKLLHLGTGRSVCAAEGVAERFYCARVLSESIHIIGNNGVDYAYGAICLIWRTSYPHSFGRKSIFIIQFVKKIDKTGTTSLHCL